MTAQNSSFSKGMLRVFLTENELRTEERGMRATSISNGVNGRGIETRLTSDSLDPYVYQALESLGYRLCAETEESRLENTDYGTGDDFESEENWAQPQPGAADLWLVDEDRLDELPDPDDSPDLRILLISSSTESRVRPADLRVLAHIIRPGRLSTVYSTIQNALEFTPRRNPRIRTQLSARCLRAERRSIGAVLSLSEGGCLLRTGETLRKGAKLDVQFALPEYGLVSTPAECRYTRKGDAGLAFNSPPPDIRLSIGRFVTTQLAEGRTSPA